MGIPTHILFMKIGVHAGESLEDILERKNKEFEVSGCSFWGYGGATCHPVTQVQPFAKSVSGDVTVLFQTVKSSVHPAIAPATEYSVDGVTWKKLPSGIRVTGSKYAIVLGKIVPENLELPLHNYKVSQGKSRGRLASLYIKKRIDKACLELSPETTDLKESGPKYSKISYSAELLEPYSVFLRCVPGAEAVRENGLSPKQLYKLRLEQEEEERLELEAEDDSYQARAGWPS